MDNRKLRLMSRPIFFKEKKYWRGGTPSIRFIIDLSLTSGYYMGRDDIRVKS
jgi:hypothetical protein